MSQQAFDEAYNDEAALALDFAVAVNEEVRDLFAAGADPGCICIRTPLISAS
jgi:5-methyltetrahydropteroyltriglutamate--homocysteine methyltransferase